MKAAFFEAMAWAIPIIQKRMREAGIEPIKITGKLLEDVDLSEIRDVEIISMANSVVKESTLDALPNLRLIAAFTTGYENVDVEAARKRGIIVTNDPVYGERTVAEFTFALMLALSRKLKPAIEMAGRGIFSKKPLSGFDLGGRTLGVIGTGHIGSRVIRFARAFDMKILCYSRTIKQELIDKFDVAYVSLDELLQQSDIITLHIPLSKETHHLINEEKLNKIKKGAILINTSRGKLIDTFIIPEKIKDGTLGGIAFDAFEGEEIWIKQGHTLMDKSESEPEDLKQAFLNFQLLQHENVILTPHVAYNTREAKERFVEINLDIIESFKKGEEVPFRVN